MEHSIFKISENRTLEYCPDSDLMSLDFGDDSRIWIDISRRNPEDLLKFLEPLELHPLAVEACLDAVPNSTIGAYGGSLFIALPTMTEWDDMERTFLSVLCLPRTIITIHERPIPVLESIAAQFSSGMRFHASSTSAALFQILDHVIDQDMVFALEVREKIDHVEELIDQEADYEITDEIRFLKRKAAHLMATLEDQLRCMSALQTIDSDSFSVEGLHDYFRDAIAHLEHAVRSVGRQTDRLTAIQQHFLLLLQDKANKRLQMLTVVSVIFLPLMLITGIYGMNFRYMPELTWRYGYITSLLMMIAVALGAVWILFRKGWFK